MSDQMENHIHSKTVSNPETKEQILLKGHRDRKNVQFAMDRPRGVVFVRKPKDELYGTVAVFKDRYGNLWDLLQPREPTEESQ